MDQKTHWETMSEEEKQEELKQKREELKEKRRDKAKERREKEMLVRREQSRRYEDQEIEGGKNLPTFRHVDMPEGLPNALFGDVAMVVDFLNAYTGLLMPDDQYPITGVALMEALAGEGSGFLYLNRLLVMLLQTLLQDELAEGYSELDMPLSEIPLTLHSVSELVRLCLRPCDAHGEESSEDRRALGGFDAVVTSEILERLETAELFELNPLEKGSLLVALCHCILMTHSVEDHVVVLQQRSAELWKDRLATLKEVNDRKKAEMKRRKEEMEGKVKEDGGIPKGRKKKDGSAKKEDKKEENKKEENKEVKVEPEPEDMINLMKSRQLMSMQAKKEKKEQDRQNKERMEKEAEEERICRQKVDAERAFQDAITRAKLVLRRVPLGTDRNHNRYWLFSDMVPGLYIEEGWVHENIDYNYTPPSEEKPVEDKPAEAEVEEDGAEKDGSTDGVMSEIAQQGAAAAEVCIETTVPKQGQNLWFVCDTQPDLEELVENLHPQGVRESKLKAKIQSKYQDILHSIPLCCKGEIGLRACDGHEELIKDLRSDINEVASRLQKGSLGYLNDNAIENLVSEMQSLNEFGECIITIQACVIKKFLQGFMAPKQQKKKKQGGEENRKAGEVDEKKLAEEARLATAVEKWKTAIRDAQTFSRMHVLLSMLDACINWDMSAENARCKVCRKKALSKKQSLTEQTRSRQPYSHRLRAKQASVRELCSGTGGGDRLILCDECKKAFHLFCLRPVLHRLPAGEWLCPACQSATARRCSRGRNYKEGTDEEDHEDDSEDEEEEEENDYSGDMGQSLRPRKKTKQSSSRLKGSKSKPKKQSPPRGRSSRQRTSHSSHADIDELERCEEILQKLIKFRYSWPFREHLFSEEADDYLEIISTPMDFQTMLGKLSQGSYRHAQAFLEDMKLVFSNAEEYNHEGSTVLSCLTKTEQSLTDLLKKLLPGISYLRRHSRKRVSRAAITSEGQQKVKKMQNGKLTRPRREAVERESKTRHARGREDEENESEEEEDEGNSKRSKRTSGKRDYREQKSDGERNTRSTQQWGARRERAGSSDEDDSNLRRSLRHNKRQKRS